MTPEISTSRHGSTIVLGEERGLLDAGRIVDAIKNRWRQGERPDMYGELARHPELRRYRSIVLDLAYAEYQERQRAGEAIDAETFARRFPSLERSLYLLIEVHGLLSQDPDLQLLQERLLWPEAGNRFLQFDLVAEIGRGAFGRVFLATEPALGGRQIVVKVAPYGGGEAEILGKLKHANIVPVYSLHEDKTTGLAAFCMPYLGRATLCDVLDRAFLHESPPRKARVILDGIADANDDVDSQESPSPPLILRKGSYVDGVVHLACQLADALAHSHGRGIYHRDMKPSNVLMTAEGRPLLLDFNLSVDAALPAWKVGGTLPYMPPEELANLARRRSESHPFRYDPRSDLFSLGVIVYELLTGKLPFGAIPRDGPLEELANGLRQQAAKGPQPIRSLNRQVDRRLARLVESCLVFDLENRPQTAQQLASAFRQELSLGRRGRRWIGNHRGLVSSLGVILLTMTVAACAFFALRPSYSVRQFQLGLSQLQRGEYSSAVDSLSNSIHSNPDSGEALFARGRAYQRLGEFPLASKDYRLASRLAPSPIIDACRGYCLSRSKYHRNAIGFYRSALEAGYDRPALLCNNIGFSYLTLGQLNDAERYLYRSIGLDGNSQAAHYNMMMLHLQRAIHGQPIPKSAFVHATRAVEIGPETADLYRVVAALYAMGAKQDPMLSQPGIEYVGKSVELGFDPKAFTSDIVYATLRKEPAFRDALKRTASASKSAKAVQLVDPLATP